MHLLIIDDNEELLYALQQLLIDAHYHVDIAKTLLEGDECITQKNMI
jgi:DNA-binding response OmpR family regulator